MVSPIFLAYPCGSWSLAKQARQGPLFSYFLIVILGGGTIPTGWTAAFCLPARGDIREGKLTSSLIDCCAAARRRLSDWRPRKVTGCPMPGSDLAQDRFRAARI